MSDEDLMLAEREYERQENNRARYEALIEDLMEWAKGDEDAVREIVHEIAENDLSLFAKAIESGDDFYAFRLFIQLFNKELEAYAQRYME